MLPFLVLAALTQALPQPDPYAPPPRDEARLLAYRAELGGDTEARAVEEWLRRHPNAPASERAMLAHRLCVDLGVLVGGERRVAACRLSADLSGDDEDDSDLAIATAFRNEPPIRTIGTVTVPLTRSAVGHSMIDVATAGARSSWIVDTGAAVTTIAESTAEALHVRRVDGATSVGTVTAIKVDGRLGMIDRLTIGTASVEHVPVLILPDSTLRLPDGSVIPGILGLPVMAAFREVTWLDGSTRLALGRSAQPRQHAADAARFYWHENGVGLQLSTTLGSTAIFLDSGANTSQLGTTGLALLTPAQRASVTETQARFGGAGGTQTVQQRTLPKLDYRLAGTPLHASRLDISNTASTKGRIGNDVLSGLALFSLDFDTMTVEVEAAKR